MRVEMDDAIDGCGVPSSPPAVHYANLEGGMLTGSGAYVRDARLYFFCEVSTSKSECVPSFDSHQSLDPFSTI